MDGAWTALITQGSGVIFAYEKDGELVGTIGGVVHRDIYGEALIAVEFFWFIQEEHRGMGIRLYKTFENWARNRGASSIQMMHLLDLMPEKVGHFYLRQGYEPIETRYSKRLRVA